MKKAIDEYYFRRADGTPIKTIRVPKAEAKCKYCGRKIRWIRSDMGRMVAAEAKLHIIDKDVPPIQAEQFISRSGKELRGVIVPAGDKGCEVGFAVHKCARRVEK